MLIEERSINKVLFRKELYATHPNQIKRFQTQTLMNPKPLTRNEKMILDLQISMKIEHHSINSQMMSNLHTDMKNGHHLRMIDILQIDLKNGASQIVGNLQIGMKKEHHSMIRRYDHAFFLWNILAQSLITESLDQNSCFLIEIELRCLHRRFDHLSTRRLQAILDRSDHEINSQAIEYFIKFCHHCQIHEKFSGRFSFTLKDDLEFNFNVIVDILYLKIKSDVNKSVLHVVNETIRFQVDR
jgi:hypothetical protein